MKKYNQIKIWLLIGLFMLFIQVIVGGITRLTGSGLSITKWEIVTGTLPPLNAQQWNEAFELYKDSPQYKKINEGMSMSEFKFIYFWEYIHRFWARIMGFVFLIPFIIFLYKKMMGRLLINRLLLVVALAALAATFGWIMVASGLINRPWVNAYKLTIHLSIAFSVYSTLLWATFEYFDSKKDLLNLKVLAKYGKILTGLIIVQIVFGGIMSGMKAGLFYPTWPDMNGVFYPQVLTNSSSWTVENLVNYDGHPFASALIQFLHRTTAYIVSAFTVFFFVKLYKQSKNNLLIKSGILLISLLVIQVLLGIFTLVNCDGGTIPVGLGVMHQGMALLLLSSSLFINYQLRATNAS